MSMFQIISAVLGFLVIALTVWQVAKNGIARSNGNVDNVNSYDHSQGGD